MLSSHSQIKGGPEPHLMTPLAYLGYWKRVDKAPYDHIVASIGQQAFVESLPHKEQNYWDACRAYCDTLYGASMQGAAETFFIDKTPEYATVWPFLTKVYPDARYIVLTRHPGAIFASFANSFFDGDFETAQKHESILERYIPPLAGMIRQTDIPVCHICYEDLVQTPEKIMLKVCDFLGIAFEANMIEYGRHAFQRSTGAGLGDPVGVTQHSRPSSSNLEQWATEYSGNPQKLQLLRDTIGRIDPADFAAIGYPLDSLWTPIHNAIPQSAKKARRSGSLSHRLQRVLIIRGRKLAQRFTPVRSLLQWFRMACDVLLREY